MHDPRLRAEDEAGRQVAATGGPILVAGEALIDLALGEREEIAAHPGGGPYNTARALGRLGAPAAYLGRLSSDRFGHRLRAGLAGDGVSLAAAVETSDPTTLALAELDAAGAASYRFYTAGTSAAGLTADAATAALGMLGAPPSMLHAGTLGLVLEPAADALEAVVGRLAGSTLVMVDPNVRPAALPDPAAYRARLARVLAATDVVKVSDQDLAWLDRGRAPRAAAAALAANGGPALVLLTRGGEGATAVLRGGATIDVPAPRVAVVDTIGAGDAFSGGFLAWWHREGLGREALGDPAAVEGATAFACLVAARTCERPGASPPRLDEL